MPKPPKTPGDQSFNISVEFVPTSIELTPNEVFEALNENEFTAEGINQAAHELVQECVADREFRRCAFAARI